MNLRVMLLHYLMYGIFFNFLSVKAFKNSNKCPCQITRRIMDISVVYISILVTHDGPYFLLVLPSYFTSCSVHTQFASVLRIYRLQMVLGVQAFLNSYFNVLYRSYRVSNEVIDVLYILMYCCTGILFVVLREWCVSYISLFAGNLP